MRVIADERQASRIVFDQISNLKGALHWGTFEDLFYIRAKLSEALCLLGLEEIDDADEQGTVSVSLESA